MMKSAHFSKCTSQMMKAFFCIWKGTSALELKIKRSLCSFLWSFEQICSCTMAHFVGWVAFNAWRDQTNDECYMIAVAASLWQQHSEYKQWWSDEWEVVYKACIRRMNYYSTELANWSLDIILMLHKLTAKLTDQSSTLMSCELLTRDLTLIL